jgi:predicted RNA-binding Zn-ribbon protein involved in translation (DUF1610 family)
VSQMVCPECGENVHRSHTHSVFERLFRTVSSYRPYKCTGCGWRGWLAPVMPRNWKKTIPTIILWLISLALAMLLAFYLTESYRSQHPHRTDPTSTNP